MPCIIFVQWDFQADTTRKPPHAYATLIYLTIRHHGGGKVTLAQVYDYIMSNFAYYRHADPGWKNSIRHNLTQHKCFIKVPRATGEPGKGGFWALDPSYIEIFESGTFKGTGRRVPIRKRSMNPSSSATHNGGAGSAIVINKRKGSIQVGERGSMLPSTSTASRFNAATMARKPPSPSSAGAVMWCASPDRP